MSLTDQQRIETAADNCEVLRARLAKYEDAEGNPKAQPSGVVLPERWSVPRPIWKDARQPYGDPLNKSDIEAAGKFNLALDEVARLNSSPVSAGDDAQYPPCDYCAEPLSYHPWHGSGLINGVESRHIHACDKCRRLLPAVSDGEYGDAYQGAREDLAIWKRRALEAEAKIREQDQIIENLGNALNAESGPTFMGEPVMPVSAGDDRKLSDIGNELHNLSCHVVHHNEGWANQLGTLASELWYWPSNAGVVDERAHPDEIAVDRFAVAMKEKLAKSREKGRHGWQNATQPHLSSLLYGHMYKADPLDVANLAMMLHQNGQAIELPWHARLNPHFKIPLGWRAQKTDGGDGFIVSSPRVNGVASNTAVFVDSPCPAHRMLFDVLAALTASAPSHSEQVREWNLAADELPASGKPVLAYYLNSHGMKRRIRAMHVKRFTVEAEEFADPDTQCVEYSEQDDCYYTTEGWYELIDNWPDYSSCAVIEGVITHWQELPAAPSAGSQKE